MKFRTKIRINFFDCDPAGIMFYGRAFYLIHSAYEKMIASAGIDDYWINENYFVPISKAETEFFKPLIPGDEALIEVYVNDLREHSFELKYTCSADGVKIFNSKTVHVFTNSEMQKIRIPDELRSALENLMDD
jgi:acyl-CoA thioesterase FadM